jgi:hypothetical protein
MFEIGIFWVIALAIGYSGALWFMGRHGDVLHGDFVHAEQQPEPIAMQGVTLPPGGSDSLQQLLASIKQQLKDAAQI